jgi:SAM-dependent methyltransferase
MRALASVGILTENAVGRFDLTPLGQTLRSDVPGSLRAWALTVLGEECQAAWGNLMHSVRTGEIAFDNVFGMDIWAYRAEHASRAQIFDDAMGNLITVYNRAVAEAYPFSNFKKIADVAGGTGRFMILLLQSNPGMSGILCDLPHVAHKAAHAFADAGVADRCAVVSGDIFESIPDGADAYVLSRVLHDWNDERALAILRNCRKVVKKHGRLIIVERVVPERGERVSPAVFVSDLQMMAMNGGRERSKAEWSALLATAGFRLGTLIPTSSVMSVIESHPV